MPPRLEDPWPGCCYDHYVSILRAPEGNQVFESAGRPPLQILRFNRVFDGCRMFCSIGMNRLVNEPVEVCAVVDSEFETIPAVIAKAFTLISASPVHLCWGGSMRGLDRIDPAFVERTGKNAIYFAQPNFLPERFATFECSGVAGMVWNLMFISDREYGLLQERGPAQFERFMEGRDVDPFVLARPTTV